MSLTHTLSASIHFSFFFFNDTATTEIYTLSLHDALPISVQKLVTREQIDSLELNGRNPIFMANLVPGTRGGDRKSTRLNSSHSQISYAVFCLKKKKNSNSYTLTMRS